MRNSDQIASTDDYLDQASCNSNPIWHMFDDERDPTLNEEIPSPSSASVKNQSTTFTPFSRMLHINKSNQRLNDLNCESNSLFNVCKTPTNKENQAQGHPDEQSQSKENDQSQMDQLSYKAKSEAAAIAP